MRKEVTPFYHNAGVASTAGAKALPTPPSVS